MKRRVQTRQPGAVGVIAAAAPSPYNAARARNAWNYVAPRAGGSILVVPACPASITGG